MNVPPIRARLAAAFVVPTLLILAASAVRAQTPPAPGTPATQIRQQIEGGGFSGALRDRISSSGLTPEQVRRRLASMGYDPRTLDPYLVENTTGQAEAAPTSSTLAAIRALGYTDLAEEITVARDERPDPAPLTPEEERARLRVFGVEVFGRGTSEFDPVISAALPASYSLGPGDELVLVITGDVEFIYTLPVTREGFIVVPQVGQISVNGLTLEALREQLYVRLGRVYSGVSRSASATTRFDISIAKTRTNQVFVTGDVTRPGSYTASPLASVLNVLYQAGGPTGNGSFRSVQILRSGQLVATVDLYQYLLSGNNLSDIRLESGDVVFVPVHGTHVAIRGEVARPAIYELKSGETVAELVGYAGGLNAPAHTRRARLSRILPPAERRDPGIDRVVIDVDLDQALGDVVSAPQLRTGDEIDVLAVNSETRRLVSVHGSVWRDGSYQFTPGMKAWDLLVAADGLMPDAFAGQAQITRRSRIDGSLSTLTFSLEQTNGIPSENPTLEEDDIVRVFSRADSAEDLTISVTGAVRNPYSTPIERGMTLRDAIVRAGGLRRTADPVVEISRMASPERRARGELAEIIRVHLDSTYFVSDEAAAYYVGHPDSLLSQLSKGAGSELVLQPYDRIFVRTVPEFEAPRVVTLSGEVKYPGAYTLRRKNERLAEVIERAGGLTATAYAGGFQLIRDGHTVDVDLAEALKNPRSPENLTLLSGDELAIPEYNAVVLVQGAVGSPAAVLYKKGEPLSYYIESAGGYTRNADKARVQVRLPNGRSETKKRKALFFSSEPTPLPGSTVTVPYTLPEDKFDLRGTIADVSQVVAALTTVTLVILRLK